MESFTMDESSKTCTKCYETKPLSAFSKGNSRLGRSSQCKVCCTLRRRQYTVARAKALGLKEVVPRWKIKENESLGLRHCFICKEVKPIMMFTHKTLCREC